ncbi:MAG: hypothetical protein ABI721_00365 [Candidatus Dojkabacteria bacterium]
MTATTTSPVTRASNSGWFWIYLILFMFACIGLSGLALRYTNGNGAIKNSAASVSLTMQPLNTNYGAGGVNDSPTATPYWQPSTISTQTAVPNTLINDSTFGWVYQSDVTCIRNTFEAMHVTRIVNIGQSVGTDGSPSPTLALIGVISEGSFVSEFDNTNGRSLTFRGGEEEQITPTSPTQIILVILNQNVVNFANFYSQPLQGVVAEGGVPLLSVGIEINQGQGNVSENLYWGNSLIGYVNGPVTIVQDIGSVFTNYTMSELGNHLTFNDFSPDNLRGIGIPVEMLGNDCWSISLAVTVPTNQILSFGVGTFQYPHYTAIADYLMVHSQ